MNDQPTHKPVDHLAAAGADAASFVSNLWHAGGDCVSAVARCCGEAAHAVGVAAATITDETITFAAHCAEATGQAIEHGVDSTVGTVKAICRENDITPAVEAIIHAPGELYDAVKQREAEFRADRPITAQVESIIFPPLEIMHAVIAGGKHHPEKLPLYIGGTAYGGHIWSENEYGGGDGGDSGPPARGHFGRRIAHNDDVSDRPVTLPGRPGGAAGGPDGHGESSSEVEHGDTYWSIARQLEGKEASNQEVLNRMRMIQKFNGNKPLRPGEEIVLDRY